MSLRARLIVAFLLLSVVPLSAVTLYSYWTSVHAFERAVEREASQTAADIGQRMAMVTDDVGKRLDRLYDASTTPSASGAPPSDAYALRARLAPLLGDAAALIDRIEFQPMPTTGSLPGAPPPAPLIRRRGGPQPPSPPTQGRPARPAGAPPMPPAVIVDMPALLAQAADAARAKGVPIDPALQGRISELVTHSLEAGMKAAAGAIAREQTAVQRAAPASPAASPELPVPPRLAGHDVAVAVTRNGRMVGHASARLNLDRTLDAVLTLAKSEQGEIPFAIDQGGALYTPDASQRPMLETLRVTDAAASDRARRVGDWIVVSKRDVSGLTFGIARPLGESLREIKRTSVRNLALGLMVVVLALIGIVPVSHGMTERLRVLTAGARQLATGDFAARVPAGSSDEFGELAQAFNQMARSLEQHQAMVVEQGLLRRELELSRLIQTEMLPRKPLRFGASEIKGVSIPAREVGGDFFNYFDLPGDRLGLLVGDVSGKGVSAALLMANVQATLRARLPLQPDLAALADALDRELDDTTPGGVFVTLFIAVIEPGARVVRYVNAGHNPQFVVRGDGGVERLSSAGLPLGLFGGHGYSERQIAVAAGDLFFFYTDGLVETENDKGDEFGADRLEAILVEAHARGIDAVLTRIEREVNEFRGGAEPFDDATLMALRI